MKKFFIVKLFLFAILIASCESKEERLKRETDEIWAKVEVDAELKAKDFDRDVEQVKGSYDKSESINDFNRKYKPYIGLEIYEFELDNEDLLKHVREKYKAVISKELSEEAYEKVQQLIDKTY